jgi:hypothetical protein
MVQVLNEFFMYESDGRESFKQVGLGYECDEQGSDILGFDEIEAGPRLSHCPKQNQIKV